MEVVECERIVEVVHAAVNGVPAFVGAVVADAEGVTEDGAVCGVDHDVAVGFGDGHVAGGGEAVCGGGEAGEEGFLRGG